MARVYHVKKARKEHACEKCGATIHVGDPYKWTKPKTSHYGGRKRTRCTTCPGWKPSEVSTSRLAIIWDAQQSLESAEDVQGVIDAAREVSEGDMEAAENIRDGFGHDTQQSEELEERGQELEGWADELENALQEFQERGEPDEQCPQCSGEGEVSCPACEGEGCDECDEDGMVECPDCEGDTTERDDWEQARDDLVDLADTCPV
jgi:hypothetical protein